MGSHRVENVEDIVTNPAEQGKYETLKEGLVKRHANSSNKLVKKLLESEELGNRIPSQFLSRLRGLASNMVPDEFLKTIWMSRLQTATQRVVTAATTQIMLEMAEIVDRVHEIEPTRGQMAPLTERGNFEVAGLRKEIQELK